MQVIVKLRFDGTRDPFPKEEIDGATTPCRLDIESKIEQGVCDACSAIG